MSNLTAIVPFYNEINFLEESINRLLKVNEIEKIILVNDFSNDGSQNLAQSISQKNSNVIYVSTKKNLGKGGAVKEGLKHVQTSHVIVHDADLEYFPEDIPEMFRCAKNNSNCIVIGSRTIGSKSRSVIYKKTYYGQKLFCKIFSILNRVKITDIASCYWILELKHLNLMNLTEKGFAIEVEVISKSLRYRLDIVEVPIKYEARSYQEGKKIMFRDALNILLKIVIFSKTFYFFDKNLTR